MNKIKRNILFFPDKEADQGLTTNPVSPVYKSDAKLRMRVRWGKNVVNFNVGYRVKLLQWDSGVQRCKSKTTNEKKQAASLINSEIQRLEDAAEFVFSTYEVKKETPTPQQFRIDFNKYIGRKKKAESLAERVGFFDYFDLFLHEEGRNRDWALLTIKKFRSLKSHLLDFNEALTFDDLTHDGWMKLIGFLRDKKALRNSSINKLVSLSKWFMKWATEKGYNTNTAFATFRPKFKTTEKTIVFLEWDELMTVYNYEFPENKKYLERTRDVFCFCCFTSLRYSDVANLKRSDVFDSYISITTVKTSDNLVIELNDYSCAILGKYRGEEYLRNLALPVITNQRMNEYIKEIGKECKLDKPITVTYYKGSQRFDEVYPKYELLGTHAGRRTFICNALMLGIAPQVVMKWTGHSDYKAMKPYIEIADSPKVESMKLFNK